MCDYVKGPSCIIFVIVLLVESKLGTFWCKLYYDDDIDICHKG